MQRRWIVAYDVACDRRRYRVEKALSDVARRIQWSVFEGLLTQWALDRLAETLAELIDPDEDSVRYYPVCSWCDERVLIQGRGGRTPDADYWIF